MLSSFFCLFSPLNPPPWEKPIQLNLNAFYVSARIKSHADSRFDEKHKN